LHSWYVISPNDDSAPRTLQEEEEKAREEEVTLKRGNTHKLEEEEEEGKEAAHAAPKPWYKRMPEPKEAGPELPEAKPLLPDSFQAASSLPLQLTPPSLSLSLPLSLRQSEPEPDYDPGPLPASLGLEASVLDLSAVSPAAAGGGGGGASGGGASGGARGAHSMSRGPPRGIEDIETGVGYLAPQGQPRIGTTGEEGVTRNVRTAVVYLTGNHSPIAL